MLKVKGTPVYVKLQLYCLVVLDEGSSFFRGPSQNI